MSMAFMFNAGELVAADDNLLNILILARTSKAEDISGLLQGSNLPLFVSIVSATSSGDAGPLPPEVAASVPLLGAPVSANDKLVIMDMPPVHGPSPFLVSISDARSLTMGIGLHAVPGDERWHLTSFLSGELLVLGHDTLSVATAIAISNVAMGQFEKDALAHISALVRWETGMRIVLSPKHYDVKDLEKRTPSVQLDREEFERIAIRAMESKRIRDPLRPRLLAEARKDFQSKARR